MRKRVYLALAAAVAVAAVMLLHREWAACAMPSQSRVHREIGRFLGVSFDERPPTITVTTRWMEDKPQERVFIDGWSFALASNRYDLPGNVLERVVLLAPEGDSSFGYGCAIVASPDSFMARVRYELEAVPKPWYGLFDGPVVR